MNEENPTAEDSGASISDRLEKYLSAEETPEPTQDEPEAIEPQAEDESVVEPEEGELEESQQPQLSTTDFAKVLGIDESMLDLDEEGNAIVKTKIDGKEGTAKFADVLKSYQLQGHIDNKARAIAEQEKAVQQRMQEVEQAAAQRIQHLETLATHAQQELMREFQSIDWQTLRHQDPAEYAARLADYRARDDQIKSALQASETERQRQEQQRDQHRQAYLAKEAERLPEVIPEWKNAEVAAKEQRELVEWAKKIGYSDQHIRALNNSSAVDIATFRKAMLFDKLQQSRPATENRVRTAPKLVKPGQAVQDRNVQTVKNLKQEIKKSGGKGRSVADYLIATGKV